MAPADPLDDARKPRDTHYTDIGVAGRKTGLAITSAVSRNQDGFENLNAFFSPEPPTPRLPPARASRQPEIGIPLTSDSQSMDIPSSSALDPTVAMGTGRQRSLPRARTPLRTGITGSPRRSVSRSAAPRSESMLSVSPTRNIPTPNKMLDFGRGSPVGRARSEEGLRGVKFNPPKGGEKGVSPAKRPLERVLDEEEDELSPVVRKGKGKAPRGLVSKKAAGNRLYDFEDDEESLIDTTAQNITFETDQSRDVEGSGGREDTIMEDVPAADDEVEVTPVRERAPAKTAMAKPNGRKVAEPTDSVEPTKSRGRLAKQEALKATQAKPNSKKPTRQPEPEPDADAWEDEENIEPELAPKPKGRTKATKTAVKPKPTARKAAPEPEPETWEDDENVENIEPQERKKAQPKGRGKVVKPVAKANGKKAVEVSVGKPKPRGRQVKKQVEEEEATESASEEAPVEKPKPRGRQVKTQAEEEEASVSTAEDSVEKPKPKRGRQTKKQVEEEEASASAAEESVEKPKPKRGRQTKKQAEEEAAASAPKAAGRKQAATKTADSAKSGPSKPRGRKAVEVTVEIEPMPEPEPEADDMDAEPTAAQEPVKKARGRANKDQSVEDAFLEKSTTSEEDTFSKQTKRAAASKKGATAATKKAEPKKPAARGRKAAEPVSEPEADQDDPSDGPDEQEPPPKRRKATTTKKSRANAAAADEEEYDEEMPDAPAPKTKTTTKTQTIPIKPPSDPNTSEVRYIGTQRIVHQKPPPVLPASVGKRRSRRAHLPPLAFWKGEKAVYSLGERRKSTSTIAMPELRQIVRVESDDEKIKKEKESKKRSASGHLTGGTKRKRAKKEAAAEEHNWDEVADMELDDAGSAERWEIEAENEDVEAGHKFGPARTWPVEDADDDAYTDQILGISRAQMQPQETSVANFSFIKTCTEEFFGTGLVDLLPGGVKRTRNSGHNVLVFYVVKGRASVVVGPKERETAFRVGAGGQFIVPRGNLYSIQNEFDMPLKMFYAQGCDMSEVGDVGKGA